MWGEYNTWTEKQIGYTPPRFSVAGTGNDLNDIDGLRCAAVGSSPHPRTAQRPVIYIMSILDLDNFVLIV